MELNQVDKVKLFGYLRSHSIDDIYFSDLTDHVLNTKKYSVQDITIYFIGYVESSFNSNTFSDNVILKMLKFIHTYFVYFSADFKDLKSSYIETVSNFQVKYEEYLKRTNSPENDEVVVSISHILSSIRDYKIVPSPKGESHKETEELNKRIEKLQEEVKECKRKIKEYQDNSALYDKKIKHRDNKIETLSEDIEKQKNKIAELNDIILSYENSIRELKAILSDNPDDENKKASGLDTLENLKKLCRELLQELSSIKTSYGIILVEKQNLITRLRELESLKQKYIEGMANYSALSKQLQKAEEERFGAEQEGRQDKLGEKINKIIIESLFKKELSTEEILAILNSAGYFMSQEQLFKCLKDLSSIMNISPSKLTLGEKVFSIHHASYRTGETFTVDLSDTGELDLLFASDFHIYGWNINTRIDSYQRLLDYCNMNGIKLIVNLGDFFDWSKEGYQFSYDYFSRCLEDIDGLAANMPKLDGLHHLVLGGNHDIDNMYLGCDFLGTFISKRDDFISLGHENCTLELSRTDQSVTKLLLAHPRETIQKCAIANSIDSICNKMGVKENDYAFKFLGHHHSSFLDFEHATCIVPSLTIDRIKNGAWHVKIYFNEKGIDDIVFLPLVLDKELYPTSRILYRKN